MARNSQYTVRTEVRASEPQIMHSIPSRFAIFADAFITIIVGPTLSSSKAPENDA
jgi:hypothetical protein